MPWQCKGCSTTVAADTTTACPSCGAKKVAWSMLAQKTRAFVVQSKRFDVLRGVGGRALPAGDPALAEVATVPTEVAWAASKAAARRWKAAGLLPPARHVLFVRLHPRKHPDLSVQVGVQLVAGEARDEVLPPPEGADPAADVVDVPALVLFGEGEAPAFDGLATLDVTDAAAPGGHAPTLEVQALKRPPRSVRVATGVEVRLLEAPRREGAAPRPVKLAHVYLAAANGDGPPALDDGLFTDADGWLCVPNDDPHGWQSGAPTERARRLEGEQLRLHWSYSPRDPAALAALPARAWSAVTIAKELTLRPSRLRGCLHVRLLRLDVRDDRRVPGWEPLASTAYALTGPDGSRLEGTTTPEGVLRHDGVVLGSYRLEAGGLVDVVEAGGAEGDPAPVELRPPVVAARPTERQTKDGPAAVRRVFLCRHADRDAADRLNDRGHARARALCRRLEGEGVDEVCVTSFTRTRQTAAPLARRLGLEPVVLEYRYSDPEGPTDADVDAYLALAEQRIRGATHDAMLVIGHSETTPELVKRLTGRTVEVRSFDQLFTVTLKGDQAELAEERYGNDEPAAASGGGRDDSIARAPAYVDPALAAAGEE